MRNRVSACRPRYIRQAALVATLAAIVAGCSGPSRFTTPIFTGSTENQRQIIGNDQPMPPPISGGAITQQDLPPLAPSGTSNFASRQAALPPGDYEWTPDGVMPVGGMPVAYTPPAAPVLPAGNSTHTVAAGQTVYAIARIYDVGPDEIAVLNNLSSPSQIHVGQRLQIPGGGVSTVAKVVPPTPVPPVVVASAPARAGTLTHPPANVSSAATQTGPRVIPGVPSIPVASSPNTAPQIPATTVAAVDKVIEPASADGTSFRWPVRGRIISGFGVKPSGQRNDGINLAVPEGTSVKAAEAGSVIYAGNELEGYGNLVLIRHAGDWVSAYAHNSDISVELGDRIRRGQTVATAGMSGSVASPQVHFELRKKAKPVNPLDYLAGV